jgi:hypothetical protein
MAPRTTASQSKRTATAEPACVAPECTAEPAPKARRKYNGPPRGSEEAKERMAKVRAAQWAKNGLVQSSN